MEALTITNISIDVFLAILWVLVLFNISANLDFKNLCWRMRMLVAIISGIGSIYIIQALIVLMTSERGPALLWDFHNMLVLLGSIIIINQWVHGMLVEWDGSFKDKE